MYRLKILYWLLDIQDKDSKLVNSRLYLGDEYKIGDDPKLGMSCMNTDDTVLNYSPFDSALKVQVIQPTGIIKVDTAVLIEENYENILWMKII